MIQTPDAQCNREINFSYSLLPHLGNWTDANIHHENLLFQAPVLINQSENKINIKELISFSSDLLLSTVKRAEDNDSLYVIRLFNPLDNELSHCTMQLNFPFKTVYLLNLNEEIIKTFTSSASQIEFHAAPLQILTFGIQI